MKEFKEELLEYLFKHSGESVDVLFIVKKIVDINYDGICTQDDINKLLAINVILRELENMDWINCYPKGGMMTGSTGVPSDLNKRQLLGAISLKARMTTNGEIEYKKSKQEQHSKNIQNIGVNYGIAAQDSGFKNLQADFQPTTNPTTVQNIEAPSTGTKTSIGKFIMNNIVWVIITTVAGGLIVGFLLYKFGWI